MRYIILLPRYLSKLFFIFFNKLKLNLAGASFGHNCCVFNGFYVLIKKGGKLIIGDNVSIQSGSYFNPLVKGSKSSIYVSNMGEVIIGDNTGISSSCIWCINSVKIGEHVNIGANCVILDNDAHSLHYLDRRNPSTEKANSAPIVIEDDVLIGTGTIVLKGVKIGARSIVGAGSVVSKSIPADCIAAGNPCKVIRTINQ